MLADRIRRLLDDEELRLRISNRVRARAPHEFSIETGVRQGWLNCSKRVLQACLPLRKRSSAILPMV